MKVIENISIDLTRKVAPTVINAVQGDSNSRILHVSLFSNHQKWKPPEGTSASFVFENLKDGHKGWYDKLPDGSNACAIAENVATITLAPAVLSSAGEVKASVVFQDTNLNQIATFSFSIIVEQNPSAGTTIENNYYQYSSMEAVNSAINETKSQIEAVQDIALAGLEDLDNKIQYVEEGIRTEDRAPAIVVTESGTIVNGTNSSNLELRGLNLYGKTTQNGTPSPDAPIPLESAGDGGSVGVTVAGKNLARPRPTVTETVSGITSTFEADGVMLVNGESTADYNNAYYTSYLASHGKRITLPAGTYTFTPELLSGSLSNASYLLAYTGKSENAATFKTITAATTLTFTEETSASFMVQLRTGGIADNARIRFQIEAGEAATAYEPYVEQTTSVPTPDGLPGIPVDGGWIADEIDLGRGVYVQRVNKIVLTGAKNWLTASTKNDVNILYSNAACPVSAADNGYCTHFLYGGDKAYAGNSGYIGTKYTSTTGRDRLWVSTTMTAAEFKSFLAEHPVTVMYPMAEPVETALDDDLLAEFAKLHSYKLRTTVFNDAGAEMKLEYVADTKTYVDDLYGELAEEILNGGGGSGTPEADGFSPVAKVEQTTDGAKITITDKTGTTTATLKNGKDGKTPVKGEDYDTPEDRAEIVNSVLSELPKWTGGSY